jgi:enamine deaminase RidA (YjgF/YER057c/UK114 family)
MSQFKPQAFNPPDVQSPPPTYKHACITPLLPTSKLVTLAGQTGKVEQDFLGQVQEAYENVHRCLKAANATPRDIVHVRHYIVNETGNKELDAKDIVERGWGDLWIKFMDQRADGHKPPDTVLGVASLAISGIFYEVEVWALVSE